MKSVVVVGGGVAGVWAAVAARRAGAEVVLIARAPGASALYGGGMQIAPDLPALLAGAPFHPFNRLYRDHLRLAADLDQETRAFTALLGQIGLPMVSPRGAARYADLHGIARSAQVVPVTVAAGELTRLRGREVAVAAVEGVGDYDAHSTAEALAELGIKASVAAAPMKGLPAGAALADLFGHPAPSVTTRAELIAYPPGFVKLPANGFELLAGLPSPHGWRLQKALDRILPAEGITAVAGEVRGFRSEGDILLSATVAGREYGADSFILAGGRFIGGGLIKTRLMREPLLDLGVYHEGELLAAAYPRLRHLEYVDPSPAFRTGLLTDAELRPMGAGGSPPYVNLRAAGSILGGYDYAGGGCGFGVPLLTGWLAGVASAR